MNEIKIPTLALLLCVLTILWIASSPARAQEMKNRCILASLSNYTSPGYAADLSVAHDGFQIMLDEDIRAGVVDKKCTLERVINERILKQAQQELKNEGQLKP